MPVRICNYKLQNAIFFALLLFCNLLLAQKNVKIINADRFRFEEINGMKIKKLIGDVKLQQEDVFMDCDSAYIYPDNSIDAFNNIKIKQGDSLTIYSNYLEFDNGIKDAILRKNVSLESGSMIITTEELFYNIRDKVARYYMGATIVDGENTLISKKGFYYPDTKTTFFSGKVSLTNPEFTLTADTLQYNIDSKISYFYDSTVIVSKDNIIYCNAGYYDSKNGKSILYNRAHIVDGAQTLSADSIWYDKKNGTGRAFFDVESKDTAAQTVVRSNYLYFNEKENAVNATDSAYFIYITNDDSLYLGADTLIAIEDTASQKRIIYAFNNVKIYKYDLQGTCDSLIYDEADSMITMYKDPIIWSEENQMTADSITMYLANKELDHIVLKKSAFMINQPHSLLFNQIKGKNIYGYFTKGQLNKLLVEGNGESIYYAKNDSGQYIGVNKSICSKMWIYMEDEDVDQITFLSKPDATFSPIQQIDPANFILRGFQWRQAERPLSRDDIF